ncbi:MAG: outer membrane beta-barrel protein [Deltaproteobacteria bacterium]|jgi:opacity protein-like surface antigen|nr:outer membrane beta-barrel protein [Deltaproteobacteria bacterium]
MKISLKLSAIAALILTLVVFAVPTAGADGGFYIDGKIGWSHQRHSRTLQIVDPIVSDDDEYSLTASDIAMGRQTNSSFVGGFGIGYNFMPSYNVPVRIDLEFLARTYKSVNSRYNATVTETKLDDNSIQTQTLRVTERSQIGVHTILANVYYDFVNDSKFTPYVGASFGLAIMHIKLNQLDLENYDLPIYTNLGWVNFAWGIGAGVNYEIDQDWSLDFRYRYLDASSNAVRRSLPVKLKLGMAIHDVTVGIRYTF